MYFFIVKFLELIHSGTLLVRLYSFISFVLTFLLGLPEGKTMKTG